jgi:hypothetical protein
MFNRTNYLAGIFSLAIVMAVTTPILTNAENVGEDWYCSDHEAHAKYEKHFKRHLEHAAVSITDTLDKIYSDQALSKEEKKAKTLAVLDKHLSKMKAGMGD